MENNYFLESKTSKYCIVEYLGLGGTAEVMEYRNQETGEIVAIKTAIDNNELRIHEEKKVLRKIKALGSENYNIVKFYEDFYYETKQFLVFEKLDIDLESFTEDIVDDGLHLSDIRVIAQQVLVALNFLHSNGMAHRDLKPNNIMLVDRSSLKVKLIDMGFTEEIETMENSRCNPLLYIPPEEILLIKPDASVDMWCLALTLIYLYIGENLFEYNTMEETLAAIFKMLGEPNCSYKCPSSCQNDFRDYDPVLKLKSLDDLLKIRPPTQDPIEREDLLSFIDLLKQMLVTTPQERITSAAALKHSFITMNHFCDFISNSSYDSEAYEAMINHKSLTAERLGPESLYPKGVISNSDESSTYSSETQSFPSDNSYSVTSGNYDPPKGDLFHAKTGKPPESLSVRSYDRTSSSWYSRTLSLQRHPESLAVTSQLSSKTSDLGDESMTSLNPDGQQPTDCGRFFTKLFLENNFVLESETSKYCIVANLGLGGTAEVFECVNQETEEIVAIKTATDNMEINLHEEKKVLRKIKARGSDNYNIVKFYEDFYYKTKQFLVFEKLDIDLRSFTEDIVGGGLHLGDIRVIAQQVLVALNFLHSNGMAHRDLKPDNIMLVDRSSLKVKLIDMGFTEEIKRMENIRCNPLLYIPPEEILLIKPDASVDMWCLALTLIYLYIGENLFTYNSMEETLAAIVKMLGEPHCSYKCSSSCQNDFRDYDPVLKLKSLDDLLKIRPPTQDPIEREDLLSFIDLLKQMLVTTPQERITSAAALKHSFITMNHFCDFISNSSYDSEAYEAMINHKSLTAERLGPKSLYPKGVISNSDESSTYSSETQSSPSDNSYSVTSGNYDPPKGDLFHAKTGKSPESLSVRSYDRTSSSWYSRTLSLQRHPESLAVTSQLSSKTSDLGDESMTSLNPDGQQPTDCGRFFTKLFLENNFVLESETSKYCIVANLGLGGTAEVFECVNQETEEIVAIKTATDNMEINLHEEKKVLRKIKARGSDNYNIVKFYEDFYYKTKQFLVFEKLDIDLRSFTEDIVGGGLHLGDIRVIAQQVLVALNFLHSNGMAHRDLKPDNIMLVDRSSLKVKLIDMGFTEEIKRMENIRCNPLLYIPPEEILLIKPDASVDMWCLALTLIYLYIGENLFTYNSMEETLAAIVKMLGEPHCSYKCSSSCQNDFRDYDPVLKLKSLDDLLKIRPPTQDPIEREDLLSFIDLLKQMLVTTPQERITSAAALKHSFITMNHFCDFISNSSYDSEAYEAMINHKSLTAERLGPKSLYPKGVISNSDESSTYSSETQSSPSDNSYSVTSGNYDPPKGDLFHAKTGKPPESLSVRSYDRTSSSWYSRTLSLQRHPESLAVTSQLSSKTSDLGDESMTSLNPDGQQPTDCGRFFTKLFLENNFVLESETSKYCIVANLGLGGTAEVFECVNQETEEIVAIKTATDNMEINLHEEKKVLRKIKARGSDNYNIVKFYEDFYYKTKQFLVFEKLDIDLRSFTEDIVGGGLHLGDIRVIAQQVLVALNFLHSNGMAHRDLKPDNIMLVDRSSLKVKLIDMGFTEEIKRMENIRCNPLLYIPPEEIMLIKPDASVDMWCLALTLIYLYIGENLFTYNSMEETLAAIVKMLGEPHCSYKCSSSCQNDFRDYDPVLKLKSLDDLLKIRPPTQDPIEREDLLSFIDLLKQMLVTTPQERITSAAALKHSFITMNHFCDFISNSSYDSEAYEAMINHKSLTAERLGPKSLYPKGVISNSDESSTYSSETQSSPSDNSYSVTSGNYDPPKGDLFHAKTGKSPESLSVRSYDRTSSSWYSRTLSLQRHPESLAVTSQLSSKTSDLGDESMTSLNPDGQQPTDCGRFFTKLFLENNFVLESETSKYCIVANLGLGGTAEVFECVNQETEEIVAIKTATDNMEINLHEEKKVLRKIKARGSDNYNIVKFYEDFYYKTKQFLVFEKLDIDLRSFTEDIVGGGLHLGDIRVIAQQVLVALNFLHSNGMAHRDLKPDNIMLVDRSSLKVKLIDMGFTEEIKRMENIRCNPLLYIPPEEILLIKPDASVDMWCLALTLIYLYIGENLFTYNSMEETLAAIVKMLGEPHCSYKCSSSCQNDFRDYDPVLKLKSLDDLLKIRPPTQDPIEREDLLSFIDLLKQMLVTTPQERITSAAALKHSFITMNHFCDFISNSSYDFEAYEAIINHKSLTAERLGPESLYPKGVISNSDESSTYSSETQSSPSDNSYSVTSGNYDPPKGDLFHAKTGITLESLSVYSHERAPSSWYSRTLSPQIQPDICYNLCPESPIVTPQPASVSVSDQKQASPPSSRHKVINKQGNSEEPLLKGSEDTKSPGLYPESPTVTPQPASVSVSDQKQASPPSSTYKLINKQGYSKESLLKGSEDTKSPGLCPESPTVTPQPASVSVSDQKQASPPSSRHKVINKQGNSEEPLLKGSEDTKLPGLYSESPTVTPQPASVSVSDQKQASPPSSTYKVLNKQGNSEELLLKGSDHTKTPGLCPESQTVTPQPASVSISDQKQASPPSSRHKVINKQGNSEEPLLKGSEDTKSSGLYTVSPTVTPQPASVSVSDQKQVSPPSSRRKVINKQGNSEEPLLKGSEDTKSSFQDINILTTFDDTSQLVKDKTQNSCWDRVKTFFSNMNWCCLCSQK